MAERINQRWEAWQHQGADTADEESEPSALAKAMMEYLEYECQYFPPMLDDDGNPVPDEIFFMAVHRLILHITTISDEDKQRSIDWLTSHGWGTGLDN